MDIREFRDWMKEAEIKEVLDRLERYSASILPHRKAEDVNAEIQAVEMKYYELEYEEEVDRIEDMAKKRLDEMKKKRQAKQKRIRERKK